MHISAVGGPFCSCMAASNEIFQNFLRKLGEGEVLRQIANKNTNTGGIKVSCVPVTPPTS